MRSSIRAIALSTLFMASMAGASPAFSGSADEKPNATAVPSVYFTWKNGTENVPLDEEFTIKTEGVYGLSLMFQVGDAVWNALTAFLGNGSYEFVADASPQARRLAPGIDRTLNELHMRANEGEIVRRPAMPGIRISVDVSVDTTQGKKETPLSRTVETLGVSGYVHGAQLRDIAGIGLSPGIYRIQAVVRQPLTLPTGAQMSLAILSPRRY